MTKCAEATQLFLAGAHDYAPLCRTVSLRRSHATTWLRWLRVMRRAVVRC